MSASIKIKLCKMISIFILPTLLFLSGCSKADTLVLSGTIESTQIDANSEVVGKLIQLQKDEGTTVKAGDVLATVDSSLQELVVKQQEAVVKLKQANLEALKLGSRSQQIQQANAAVKAAKANLDELKAGTRPEQLRQSEADVEALNTSVSNAETAVNSAQINYNYLWDKYNTLKSLYGSNAASENDLSDAKFKVDTANQQLISAQDQLKTAQAKLQSAQAQLDYLKNGASDQAIQVAQANYEQAQAALDLLNSGSTEQSIEAGEADLEQSQAVLEQAKVNLGKYQIKSPIDGTYLLRNANIGDIVNIGTSIGTISYLTDLTVKVYIPQRNINLIALNQEIALKTLSLPGKTIKGKITFIASEAEFTPKNIETSEAKENTVFQLKMKIMDNIESLRPGMTVDAYIPLSK